MFAEVFESQNWYSVIGLPPGSLTENRLEAAVSGSDASVRFAVVTTGGGGRLMLMLKGAQAAVSAALQPVPSKARTWMALAAVPVTNVIWESCEADIVSTVPSGCCTPLR